MRFRDMFTHTKARNQLHTLVVYVSLIQAGVISEGTSTEKLPEEDVAVGKSVGNFLNY